MTLGRTAMAVLITLSYPALGMGQDLRDFEATPFGWMHPSCMFPVAAGEIVDGDRIIDATGQARRTPPCSHGTYRWDGTPMVRPNASTPEGPAGSGWLGSLWQDVLNVDQISGQWTVPRVPPTTTDEYFYIFNGIETSDGLIIIQPVLQWQGLYGSPGKWYLRSWRYEKDNSFYSAAIEVQPGQMIVGTVNGSNCNTLTHICQTWQIDTSLATSTAPLTMVTTTLVTTPNNINGVPQVIQRAVAGALEGTMSSCQDLPPDGVLDFTKILVHAYS